MSNLRRRPSTGAPQKGINFSELSTDFRRLVSRKTSPSNTAAKFIAAYFERYNGEEISDAKAEQVRCNGYTLTLRASSSYSRDQSPQGNLRSAAERAALNTPLQARLPTQ